MALLKLFAVLSLMHLIQCSTAQPNVEFPTLVHRVQEDSRVLKVELTKNGENQEEVIVLVTPLTFNEFYVLSKGPLPPQFDSVELPDPAEYDVNGKQDFIRNGPIKYVFNPSSKTETGSIEILFNDDSINEADEGFLLLIEVEKTDQKVAILRGGLTLVILVDEDPLRLGFEQPQYEVLEENRVVSDLVYITKNGMESEQTLRFLVENLQGSALRGEDYNLLARTEINFPPDEERLAFSVQLLDDRLPEETESFQLLLVTEDDQSNISFSLTTTTVNIVDDDVMTVGFEQEMYTVSEADKEIEVCVAISSPADIDLTVIATLSTSDDTAKDGVDYTHIKEFVSLPTYDEKTRICYKIPILNNKDIEQSEEFTVLLKPGVSTPPNVRLQPGQVQVRIVDDELVNECLLGLHSCHEKARCVDTYESFRCICKNGYSGNGVECNDIDECLDRSAHHCHDDAICTNIKGGFSCSCPRGYSGNGIICILNTPRHECLQDSDCDKKASCMGKPQGNQCVCIAGYSGNGKSCTEINECTSDIHSCPPEASCINTQGSYFCRCKPGYTSTGRHSCRDRNECVLLNHNCDRHAQCTNTVGSFTCTCNPEYTGDGTKGNCNRESSRHRGPSSG